jgi:hypothetical protein
MGDTGATGATGSPYVSSYAFVFNTGAQTLSAATSTPSGTQIVSFDNGGGGGAPSSGIGFSNGGNTLTLEDAGVYYARYTLTGTPTFSGQVSLRLGLISGTSPLSIIEGSTVFSSYIPSSIPFQIYGDALWRSSAGDQIQLLTNTPGTITLSNQLSTPIAPTLGNHSFSSITASTTITSTPITVLAGSSIYVAIQSNNDSSVQFVSSLIDNQSNAFQRITNETNNPVGYNIGEEIWFFDGVGASTSYTVTATFPGSTDITLQVAEFRNTGYTSSNPSWTAYDYNNSSEVNNDSTSNPNVFVGSPNTPSLIFGAAASANLSGTQTFQAVPGSTILIDASPVPASPSGILVAGASFLSTQQPSSSSTVATIVNATTSGTPTSTVWICLSVVIQGVSSTYITPPNNASLAVQLLGS